MTFLRFFTTKLLLPFLFVAFASSAVSAQSLSLEELVKQTKRALLTVEEDWEAPKLKLQTVRLEISAGVSVGADGKVSFWVFDLGGEVESTSSSSMTLVLSPPDAEAGSEVSSSELSESLAELILSASDAIEEARKGRPELNVDVFQADLVFGVVQSGDGGIEIAFPPFAADFGGSASSVYRQKISVTFSLEE